QQRRAQAEARWQQVIDDPAGIAGRAGMADRLVQHQHQPRRRVEWFAIDADRVVRDLVVGVKHLAFGIGHAALAEHERHLLAAAVAEVGEQPDELHRQSSRPRRGGRGACTGRAFTASMILKPSRSATARVCPTLSTSTDSYGRCRLATSHRRPPGLSASAATAMKRRPMSGRLALPWVWTGGLVTMTSYCAGNPVVTSCQW